MIRYYHRISITGFLMFSYYCTCMGRIVLIEQDGRMSDTTRLVHDVKLREPELDNTPDPYPIEERYINATDRPSLEGFKYVEPWS